MPNFSSAATPLVGSSSSSSLGRATSAIATSSSLRMPSGSSPAGRPAYALEREARKHLLRRLLGALGARDALGDEQVLAHAERGEELRDLERARQPHAVISRGERPTRSWPSKRMRPLSGRR